MRRWHQEKSHLERQQKIDRRYGRAKSLPLGKYRKRHALDCGKPHCSVCHWGKYPARELHEHEILADITFAEQLQELRDAVGEDDRNPEGCIGWPMSCNCWMCEGYHGGQNPRFQWLPELGCYLDVNTGKHVDSRGVPMAEKRI